MLKQQSTLYVVLRMLAFREHCTLFLDIIKFTSLVKENQSCKNYVNFLALSVDILYMYRLALYSLICSFVIVMALWIKISVTVELVNLF